MHRIALALALLLGTAAAAQAQAAPFCQPEQLPTFGPPLVALNDQIGGVMGDPLECLHPDPTTGDSVQQTSTGIAVIQQITNQPGFVSGYEHWTLTPGGVVYWVDPASSPPVGERPPMLDAIVNDAATRTGVDPSVVQVVRWQHVDWPDSSLGCPQPGVAYAQVIIPGWRIDVQVGNQALQYHTDAATRFVQCTGFQPRLPPIDAPAA